MSLILQHRSAPVTFNHQLSNRLDPVTDRAEQVRRCHAIDQVGYLCGEYGIDTVRRWVAEPELAEPAAAQEGLTGLVEDFGPELLFRWIRYHAHLEGKN